MSAWFFSESYSLAGNSKLPLITTGKPCKHSSEAIAGVFSATRRHWSVAERMEPDVEPSSCRALRIVIDKDFCDFTTIHKEDLPLEEHIKHVALECECCDERGQLLDIRKDLFRHRVRLEQGSTEAFEVLQGVYKTSHWRITQILILHISMVF